MTRSSARTRRRPPTLGTSPSRSSRGRSKPSTTCSPGWSRPAPSSPSPSPAVEAHLVELSADAARYKVEKREILEGSAAVGPEGQTLDKDGVKGVITGAQEWEHKLEVLGAAGDQFDLSALYLQMSLVMGTIALVLKSPKLQWAFYGLMVLLGLGGAGYAWIAFGIAEGA